jgi:hypothetical protein
MLRNTFAEITPTAQRNYSDDDLFALAEVKRYYSAETKKCEKLPGISILTEEEFKRSSSDFKELIETPRKRKQPIYIISEYFPATKLHPKLETLVTAIKANKPYHTFITASLGQTWPLLLRLYFGLESGFKISIEQLHSMIKVCYWRDRGFSIQNISPFTNEGKVAANLIIGCLFKPDQQLQRKRFLKSLRASGIPEGERMLQVINIDPNYFRIAMSASPKDNSQSSESRILELLIMHDSLHHVPKIGLYSEEVTAKFSKRNAAEIFNSLIEVGTAFYRLFFINKKPVILLLSQTMLKLYTNAMNPDRKMKVVRRLGPFSPNVMEHHSDKNERAINLFAPGISNPLITHGQVVYPAFGLEHDDYHVLYEAQLSLANLAQINRVKTSLRRVLDNDSLYTAELFRCIDRERSPDLNEYERFYETIKYVFLIDIHDYNSALKLSSVIPLIDMVLEPEHWPYYKDVRTELIKSLLPTIQERTEKFYFDVEESIRAYAVKTKNDYSLIAILMICQYYLNDKPFCQALLDLNAKYPKDSTLYTWRKELHGHLYPVLILNGRDVALTDLITLTFRTRFLLNAKIPNTGKQLTEALPAPANDRVPPETKLAVGEILLYISDFDAAKRKIVVDAKGVVILEAGENDVAQIKITSSVLKKELRDKLNLDRVLLTFPTGKSEERCTYLKSEGMVVEDTGTPDKYLVTFFKDQKLLVDAVSTKWNEVKADKTSAHLKYSI